MAVTPINNITSGYNVTKINSNFQNIQTKIDGPLVSSQDGQNTMFQDFDMNGYSILNAVTNINNPGSLLTVSGGDSRYYKFHNVTIPSLPADAANKGYVDLQDQNTITYTEALVAGVAPGAGTGSFQQAGTSASIRTFQDKMRDVVSVKDYGALGNDSHDDTTAFNAAFNYALSRNLKVYIPAGKYVITSPLSFDMSSVTGLNGTGRVSFVGDGAHCTQIRWAGSATGTAAMTFIGGDWATGGSEARSHIGGFRLVGADPSVSLDGLSFKRMIGFRLEDVQILQFMAGLILQDSLAIHFDRCTFNYNSYGSYAEQSAGSDAFTGSTANELVFTGCQWIANRQHGAMFNGGSEIVFTGGSFEGNGLTGPWTPDAQTYALRVSNGGSYGPSSLIMTGTHFEGNGTYADIWIDNFQLNAIYTIIGCDFSRNGAASVQSAHCIYFENVGSAKAVLNVIGSGFDDVNGATGTSTNRYVALGNVGALTHTVNLIGNLYGQTAAAPVIAGISNGTRSAVNTWANWNGLLSGTNPPLDGQNITSVTRLGAGSYQLNFQTALANTHYAIAGSTTTPGYMCLNNKTTTTCTVQTYNPSGTLTDLGEMSLHIVGGGLVTE